MMGARNTIQQALILGHLNGKTRTRGNNNAEEKQKKKVVRPRRREESASSSKPVFSENNGASSSKRSRRDFEDESGEDEPWSMKGLEKLQVIVFTVNLTIFVGIWKIENIIFWSHSQIPKHQPPPGHTPIQPTPKALQAPAPICFWWGAGARATPQQVAVEVFLTIKNEVQKASQKQAFWKQQP